MGKRLQEQTAECCCWCFDFSKWKVLSPSRKSIFRVLLVWISYSIVKVTREDDVWADESSSDHTKNGDYLIMKFLLSFPHTRLLCSIAAFCCFRRRVRNWIELHYSQQSVMKRRKFDITLMLFSIYSWDVPSSNCMLYAGVVATWTWHFTPPRNTAGVHWHQPTTQHNTTEQSSANDVISNSILAHSWLTEEWGYNSQLVRPPTTSVTSPKRRFSVLAGFLRSDVEFSRRCLSLSAVYWILCRSERWTELVPVCLGVCCVLEGEFIMARVNLTFNLLD